MSKFIVQVFVSVMVAVSAAIGFSPSVREEVNKTLGEAKAFTQEVAQSILHTANVEAEAKVSAEASTSTEASSKSQVEGTVELGSEANLELDQALDRLSEINTNTLLSTDSATQLKIKSNDPKLKLKNKTESQLNLEVSIGN